MPAPRARQAGVPENATAGRPLQNRVTPSGDLIATPAHGTLMGNRGRLHDPARRIVRRVAGGYRAWVTCRLAFGGRRRVVMAPNRYTELFFLDEATALAAGHRPCGECRRADFRRFRATWLAANPDRGLGPDAPIDAIDRELHRDRLRPKGQNEQSSSGEKDGDGDEALGDRFHDAHSRVFRTAMRSRRSSRRRTAQAESTAAAATTTKAKA